MTQPAPASAKGAGSQVQQKHQFINFTFYKVEANFYPLMLNEKTVARQEFLSAMDKYHDLLITVPYALTGLRADCDLLLWRISNDLEILQEMSLRLRVAGLGKYLTPVYSFLALVKPPVYTRKPDRKNPSPEPGIVPGEHKYLFIYPFAKSREWYMLTDKQRQDIMDEHLRIAEKHPGVQRNTKYLYGLDDNDFVAAYECDHPQDFLEFLKDLRGSEASRYTPKATPLFTCVRKDIAHLTESIG